MDFDRMFAEMQGGMLEFVAYGKHYRIPAELPAQLVLELARHGDGEALPPPLLERAAECIFGRATLDELCARPDFTLAKLEKMLEWAFAAIGGEGGDGGAAAGTGKN